MIQRIILALTAAAAALVALLWAGLKGRAKPFPPYPESTPTIRTIPLPADLPEPVKRYYRATIGEEIPVIETAVITLSGRLRFKGITFPARMRFTHEAGRSYRHYLEALVFNYPLLRVNESYLDGHSRLELPFGVVENQPKIDLAANMGLWGESFWLPTIFVTDPRVRWEAIDATHARVIVPCADGSTDSLTLTFDPMTGLLAQAETMRWRDAADTEKQPWQIAPQGWQTFHGIKIPSPGAVTWADEGTPWLVASVDDVAYNVDLSTYLRGRGV
ncbi:MAG: hypothetical protein K8J31_05570 [Anaerolineae bacterium]|nr:hypothetical protein [Anaerolineae bacterium]